ncbi:MAG TPA: OsmC family protein [Caulobacteraceae bacterium]|jgi:organic hydroperoxide reductase OsmC/OhrA|nr:OsmC family protein [Caulobacteraceae bacterium]
MPEKRHHYRAQVLWTGNHGVGTRGYREYGRDHEILGPAKPAIPGSSDPAFRGDATRWNPEELLVGSLSACHQLWYLHLCAEAGVVVTAYEDQAEGEMLETADGGGRFTTVTLRPHARLAPGSDTALAASLHHKAHAKCFLANSVNFEVSVEPTFEVEGGAG